MQALIAPDQTGESSARIIFAVNQNYPRLARSDKATDEKHTETKAFCRVLRVFLFRGLKGRICFGESGTNEVTFVHSLK